MRIGIPKEVHPGEMRVATTPEALAIIERIAERGPPVPPMIRVIRSTRLAGMLYSSIGDYLRLITNGVEIPRKVFISDLVNALVGTAQATAPSER